MKKPRKFSPGQRIWEFDVNRRIYRDDSPSPVYAEHFVECRIVGIEGMCYVIEHSPNTRYPHRKKEGFIAVERNYFSDAGKDDKIWDQNHRPRISSSVLHKATVDQLRQIAAIIGYVPEDH